MNRTLKEEINIQAINNYALRDLCYKLNLDFVSSPNTGAFGLIWMKYCMAATDDKHYTIKHGIMSEMKDDTWIVGSRTNDTNERVMSILNAWFQSVTDYSTKLLGAPIIPGSLVSDGGIISIRMTEQNHIDIGELINESDNSNIIYVTLDKWLLLSYFTNKPFNLEPFGDV